MSINNDLPVSGGKTTLEKGLAFLFTPENARKHLLKIGAQVVVGHVTHAGCDMLLWVRVCV